MLYLAAQHVVNTPELPKVDTTGLKHGLAPILGNPLLWVGLFVFLLLGLYLSGKTSRLVKLVALGIMALLVVGWDSQQGVLRAAAGSQAAADQWLLTGLAVGAAVALLRGPKGRTAVPGGSPSGGRRGFLKRGRRL
jgi:hypothetical protein